MTTQNSTVAEFAMEAFLELARTASCIGLGEVTHGTRQILELKTEMALAAIRELGFQIVALEVPTAVGIKLDQYINSEIDAVDQVLASSYHIYDAAEFKSLLGILRTENSRRTTEMRVQILGVDAIVETETGLVFKELAAEVETLQETKEIVGAFAHPREGLINFDDVRKTLDAVEKRRISDPTKFRLTQLLESLTQHHERFRVRDFEGRDRNMAENVLKVLERGKTLFWAHNAHVSSRSSPNPSMPWMLRPAGFFLREKLGNSYIAVGTLIGEGDIWALREEPEHCFSENPERFTITGISYNKELWEHDFATSASNVNTWLNLRATPVTAKKRIRSFLGSYAPSQGDRKYEIDINPGEEFDAIIFLPRSDIPTQRLGFS